MFRFLRTRLWEVALRIQFDASCSGISDRFASSQKRYVLAVLAGPADPGIVHHLSLLTAEAGSLPKRVHSSKKIFCTSRVD